MVSVLAKVFPSYLGKLFLATIERSKSKEESRKDVSMKNQGKVCYQIFQVKICCVALCYLFFSLTSKDSSKEFSVLCGSP